MTEVAVAGNHNLPDDQLRGRIKVEKGRFFSRGNFSQRLVRTSAENLKRTYESEGFSSVTVTPEVKRSGGNISVQFRVNEGPRDIVASLHVVGNNTVPVATLAPARTESHRRSALFRQESRRRPQPDWRTVSADGLPERNFSIHRASSLGKNSHQLDVTYTISEGPKVLLDSVMTLGAKVTKQSLIDKTVQLKTETPLRADDLLAAEGRLYSLAGVFDWAEIDPRRPITTQTQEDVLVKLHEARQNDIRYGFGFEVVNRGGSIPSGTVALPGLPPVGLPSSFRDKRENILGPSRNVPIFQAQLSRAGRDVEFRGSRSETDPARLCLLCESAFCRDQLGFQLNDFGRTQQ